MFTSATSSDQRAQVLSVQLEVWFASVSATPRSSSSGPPGSAQPVDPNQQVTEPSTQPLSGGPSTRACTRTSGSFPSTRAVKPEMAASCEVACSMLSTSSGAHECGPQLLPSALSHASTNPNDCVRSLGT